MVLIAAWCPEGVLQMFLKWIESLEDLTLGKLGPLQQLIGVWHGRGFTIIARPDGQHGQPFRLKLNATKEILVFIPILGGVFNRGSIHLPPGPPVGNQSDIKIHGLMYIQFIVDEDNVAQVLHFETGQWLLVPETTVPRLHSTIVRQATILHGATFIVTGDPDTFTPMDGPPTIPDENSIPIDVKTGKRFDLTDDYIKPFKETTPPKDISVESIINPNIVLQQEARKLPSSTKTSSITLTGDIMGSGTRAANSAASPNNPATATPRSDIGNIPFLQENADVRDVVSTFYVETVPNGNHEEVKQLQYTQNTMLRFDTVDWPHISVATLRYFPFKADLPGDIQGLIGRVFSIPT